MKDKIIRREELKEGGTILPSMLSLMVVLSILAIAVLTLILSNISIVADNTNRTEAFNIAEAGVNYYLWHMDHNGQDFKDGQSTPTTPDPVLGYGPYTHTYYSANNQPEGTFTLWVKPQSLGSTIATIRSTGTAINSTVSRTLQAQIGARSFASYGLVSDSEFWFGSNETADGPVFSNIGVHMDGPNTGTVGSANATYVPSSMYGGDGNSHPGVWCSLSVTTPNCATRDKSTWQFPKPSVDFNQVSASLCNIKKVAFSESSSTSSLNSQSNPCALAPTSLTPGYLPKFGNASSNTSGYLIQLNSNNTYNVSKVLNETEYTQSGSWWTNTITPITSYSQALTLQSIAGGTNVPIPSSGVIFAENNVWVMDSSGANINSRITIAAGQLFSGGSPANINIAGPLVYGAKNGSDALGLVAQNNVFVKPYAPPTTSNFNFEIDAAIIAQQGSATWETYYGSNQSNICTPGWVSPNQTLTFYGSVATRQPWTWNMFSNGCGVETYDSSNGYYWSGIENTTTQFDYNLQFAPPPSYPITGQYQILSWREVLSSP